MSGGDNVLWAPLAYRGPDIWGWTVIRLSGWLIER
jgi:hypothetical protein